jgi:hypothetical protein
VDVKVQSQVESAPTVKEFLVKLYLQYHQGLINVVHAEGNAGDNVK